MNISVDEVQDLGLFVEIEIMTIQDDVEQAKQKLKDIATRIGLKEKDKPTMPYRDLLIKAHQKIKKNSNNRYT